jgi:EpsI family protein
LVATVFLAMLANGLRAYAVVMIGHFIGMDAASDHMLIGYVFFGILIVLLLVVGSLFSDKQSERPISVDALKRVSSPSSLRGLFSAAVIVLVVFMTPITAGALQESILQKIPPAAVSLPAATGSWKRSADAQTDWTPLYIGDFEQVHGRYAGSSHDVDVYAITYRHQAQGSELITSQNSIFDPEVWIQIRQNTARADLPSGEVWQYVETELLQQDKKRLIRHWYLVNSRPAGGQLQVKLVELWNTLRGQPSSSSVVAISTEFFDDVEAASASLDDFYQTVLANAFGEPH